MLTLNIVDGIKKVFNSFGDFVEKNFSEPWLWIAMFVILLVLAYYVIKELGDK